LQSEWGHFLGAMTLTLVRISGIVMFAPFFSSNALTIRTKAVFVLTTSYLLAPLVAVLPNAQAGINYSALIGELAVGLVFGLSLSLITELLLFAGQIVGLQFSFSLVNLMDPGTSIQTPLLSELFQLMGTLLLLATGFDRLVLASLVRSFRAAPLGSFILPKATGSALLEVAGGIFLSALQLTAPVLTATLLVEVAGALLGRLSPQLPVMSFTVPLKTLTGFALLAGSMAAWPRFLEARFNGLLNLAEKLLSAHVAGG